MALNRATRAASAAFLAAALILAGTAGARADEPAPVDPDTPSAYEDDPDGEEPVPAPHDGVPDVECLVDETVPCPDNPEVADDEGPTDPDLEDDGSSWAVDVPLDDDGTPIATGSIG